MSVKDLNKADLKSIITEILAENPEYFKRIIQEILVENQIIINEEQAERRKKLEKMISDDFEKYDEVFKSLA